MGLGTKNRQLQRADYCKGHLREKYAEKLVLVEQFIEEFEGFGRKADVTRWGQFSDIKDVKSEALERLDEYFNRWLKG